MRIPSGKTDIYMYFVAVDSSDLKTRETGLSSFTVYRSRNGAAEVAYTTPTITEIDTTNMPGVYALLIDEDTTIASTSDSEEYCLHITQASMAPVTRVIELYRRDTTSGQTATITSGGVTLADGVSHGGTLGSSTATLALSRATITSQSANTVALTITGNGTGDGVNFIGGADGNGFECIGGATSGNGIFAWAQTDGRGFVAHGNGATRPGIEGRGGVTSHGIRGIGGATSGHGMYLTATSGDGFNAAGGTAGHGISAAGAGAGDGMQLTAGGTGVDFDADMTGNITGNLSGSVGSVTGAVGSVTGAVTVGAINANVITATSINADAITAAKIANGAIDAATFAADVDAEILSYIVDDATKIDASALNTATVTTIPAILVDTAEIGAAGAGLTNINLPNQTMDIVGNITGNLSGSVGSVTGAVGSVTGSVGSVVGLTASNLDATISSRASAADLATVAGYLDTEIAAILSDTNAILADTGTDGVVVAAASKTGYSLSAAGITAIWAEVMEGAVTAVQMMRGFAATLMGKASGLDTTTAVYRDVGDTKDRITATVDADGNRTAVTRDLT